MVMGKSLYLTDSYNRVNQFCFDSTEQLKIALLTLIHATTVILGLYAEEHARNIMQKQIFLHTDATIEHHIHMFTSDKGSFIP